MKKRVGIMGGGQLGQMLSQSARKLDLSPWVFDSSSLEPPALKSCDGVESKDLRKFLTGVEVVVFENEWVDSAPLRAAAEGLSVRFAPALDVIERLRDKLSQKEVLARLGIPMPKFFSLSPSSSGAARAEGLNTDALKAGASKTSDDLNLFLEKAWAELGDRMVFKWARHGYDGHGVYLADFTPAEEDKEEAQVITFLKRALDRGIPVYVEERVDFLRELAVVAVRSVTGEFVTYPLVVSEQRGGICYRVTGPAVRVASVSSELERQAQAYARKLAEDQKIEGAFAIEFFETRDGRLLVNEIAPRVHNSGHFTQDACEASQFENHWRAALGLPLGSTEARAPFAMLNLLGPEGVSAARASQLETPMVPTAPLYLHWYDKKESRPRRKLGHVNAVGRREGLSGGAGGVSELEALIRSLDQYRDEWVQTLRG